MLHELLYLGPEQKLRRLISSIYVQDTNRAMIEENAGKQKLIRKRH
jgi:hypothetical protein